MRDIKSIFAKYPNDFLSKKYIIEIELKSQTLRLYENYLLIENYKISSSKFGEGCEEGSNKTPLGAHYIKEFIGSDAPAYTIFKNRVPTSQKVEIVSSQENSNEDIISSRILWLDGLDKGKNKGGNVDSYTRYIYIHGTNEEGLIGEKASHGCIRMSNNDIVNLCKKDLLNTFVYIFN